MVKQPQVSVVIPTYNRAAYLREAIESVLAQQYPPAEIVVSDNASSDNTAEVVAFFDDNRIRYHRQPANVGMTANWQTAISLARHTYVAPLSDDDCYLPEHLANGIEALERYPQAAYYSCPAVRFGGPLGGNLRPVAIKDDTTPLLYLPPSAAVNFLGLDNPGPMMTMICRRQAFSKPLFWGKPDYIPQDLLVMTQLMAQGGFVFGNQPTTQYRLHDSNTSYRPRDRRYTLKLNCMVWYGIRFLSRFLLKNKINSLAEIERHGLEAESPEHVVPLVLALSSFDSPNSLKAVAQIIFKRRTDMDLHSARFRMARYLGFMFLPFAEKWSQLITGWRP
jgi:glycosyltransferase involved in cell wall biosynthesis